MYGALRFLYNDLNLISDSDSITASSQAYGIIGGVEKILGTGSATMFSVGNFSATDSLTYTVQIDSVSSGNEIGQSTFRWKTSDTADGTWEASAQSTATSLTTLNNGTQIAFIAGTGNDFELWDTWQFEATALYSISHLLNLNRHKKWRSGTFLDENLLSNGDMEEGFTSGLADDWSKVGSSQTFAEETTTVHTSGGSAQKVTVVADGEDCGISQSVTLTAGSWYHVSAWVYQNSQRDFTLACSDLNGSSDDTTVPATTWTECTWTTYSSAGGSQTLQIYQTLGNCTTSDYVIIDDVQIFELPTFVIDLGSAQTPTAIILQDHNITSTAEIKLQANASNAWTSPSYDTTMTVQDPAIEYISGNTYRYWRVVINDPDNSDGYNEISELFVGTYLELSRINADWGSTRIYGKALHGGLEGNVRQYIDGQQERLNLNFNITTNTDFDNLNTMRTALLADSSYVIQPLWVHLFYDVDSTLFLMYWENIANFTRTFVSPLINNISMSFVEQIKRHV